MIDKSFELKAGDIVTTPVGTYFVKLVTMWGGMRLSSITYEEYIDERIVTSDNWIRYLDSMFGARRWELYRNIGDLQYWPLPRVLQSDKLEG